MRFRSAIFIAVCALGLSAGAAFHVSAATIDELKQRINSHSDTIKKLEDEITRYQSELSKTSAQAKNLQSTVQSLDVNAKKLGTDIKVTETKVERTNLTIQSLSLEIKGKLKKIGEGHEALASTLRELYQTDSQSLLENLMIHPTLAAFWGDTNAIGQFQSKVGDRLADLKALQAELLKNKLLTEEKKQELTGLKNQLSDQKTIVEVNKGEKQKLLTETKNQEAGYKKIIADRLAKKKAFEDELYKFESQLKLAIDPKSVPKAQTGILAWPLTQRVITQYFGNTDFALTHAQLYNGTSHNGIDLKAAIGTSVFASGPGKILGIGDTDTVCPGASYGKWVMIEHPNGLSTLYAHLSIIKVSPGQQVGVGDTIGYSGMTGYATGPHLHFTVYASQGVKIMTRKSQSCGGTYTMPIADLKAYLNPLMYL